MLRESVAIVRMERGVIISRTQHGYVCANAGVDASNVGAAGRGDPAAARLRCLGAGHPRARRRGHGRRAWPIIVSDSFGRPWRWGIVDIALGVAGFSPLDDWRGRPDAAGRTMHATVVAVADELASVAELASGKTSGRPLVLVRGATLPAGRGLGGGAMS